MQASLVVATRLARNLKGGEVIELIGDLGSGKTAFTRGLVVALGSEDHVSSPTFTLSNVYNSQSLTVYHYDLYRLADAGLLAREMEERADDAQAVTIVEWAQVVHDVLPKERIRVALQTTGETSRTITVTAPAYICKGLYDE